MNKLTNNQWLYILHEGLAIQCVSRKTTGNQPLYALNMGESFGIAQLKKPAIPREWENKLNDTLRLLFSLSDVKDRMLLLVTGVAPSAPEYISTFSKCAGGGKRQVARISLAGETPETVKRWILKSIPVYSGILPESGFEK